MPPCPGQQFCYVTHGPMITRMPWLKADSSEPELGTIPGRVRGPTDELPHVTTPHSNVNRAHNVWVDVAEGPSAGDRQ